MTIRPKSKRIIGFDPGLRNTGWGVIDVLGSRLSFVACGTIKTTTEKSLADRLVQLHAGIEAVIIEMKPDEAAVEQTFVNKDAVATLKLGHARAIALLVPARAGLTVAEYAPNQVKKSVVGVGHAEKEQVHVMVKMLLPQSDANGPDAADALAVAITHAHWSAANSLTNAVLAGRR